VREQGKGIERRESGERRALGIAGAWSPLHPQSSHSVAWALVVLVALVALVAQVVLVVLVAHAVLGRPWRGRVRESITTTIFLGDLLHK
jgi:hypothetical protein